MCLGPVGWCSRWSQGPFACLVRRAWDSIPRRRVKLEDDRMGHADGSVGARQYHITAGMRQTLCDALTEQWKAALHARKALAPRSPVGVLDRLPQALQ